MNTLRNKVLLIGNVGKDPDFKELENGNAFARFTLATSESFKNAKGQKTQQTQWHNLVAWGHLARTAHQFLSKGNEVAIEGKIVHRQYDDKDGNTRFITEVVVAEILLLRNKKNAA